MTQVPLAAFLHEPEPVAAKKAAPTMTDKHALVLTLMAEGNSLHFIGNPDDSEASGAYRCWIAHDRGKLPALEGKLHLDHDMIEALLAVDAIEQVRKWEGLFGAAYGITPDGAKLAAVNPIDLTPFKQAPTK